MLRASVAISLRRRASGDLTSTCAGGGHRVSHRWRLFRAGPHVVGVQRWQRVTRWLRSRCGRRRRWLGIDFVVVVAALDPCDRHRRWAAHSSRCAQRQPHAIPPDTCHHTDGSKNPEHTQRALTPVKTRRPKKTNKTGRSKAPASACAFAPVAYIGAQGQRLASTLPHLSAAVNPQPLRRARKAHSLAAPALRAVHHSIAER